ncbi:protocadherin gamma-C5-like isoform X13 [Clupea harengus]|uniref:Protocadherin gamma-C5-like isoform X13 n=1 Tax=Clupea harengus TaxID=7950 RepID=A0A6P8FN58_CLUHA|nr:protocadherin gamma-C5-like isoform X13 [Clupea harengus]
MSSPSFTSGIRLELWLHLFLMWTTTTAQIRYTIPEELSVGSVVGRIAKDLGLDLSEISDRKLRIASEAEHFSVDLGKGNLLVSDIIDREELCSHSNTCMIPLEIIIENPLQLYRVEVEIQDINDNSPSFKSKEHTLKIAESTALGVRFSLERAQDPDVGSNSLKSYTLSKNDHFKLNVKDLGDGRKVPELVLDKLLDREKQAVHHLFLTALDGGNPANSGTSQIVITVLDINDNNPVFDSALYKTTVRENSALGTSVLTVEATDLDDGPNGEIEYSFGKHTPDSVLFVFQIEPQTGQICLNGVVDYEMTPTYRITVIARDKGIPEMEGESTVQIDVADVNDNPPEIILTSQPSPVREDVPNGTVVALIRVRDPDTGDNGKVTVNIPPKIPFALKHSFSNNYALVTKGPLDREKFTEYNIEVSASDLGSPPLSSQRTIPVRILDVNDNAPTFSQSSYNVYMNENNIPGSIIYSVSASDADVGDNSKITYSVLESKVQDITVASYVYINSDNGSIFSMNAFDYEKMKVFQIIVQAKDQGSPALSSNATVHVFILDQNDNVPSVIYPSAVMGSVSHQRMPRSAKTGHLVTKVTAVDADSGHNAWISYRLAEATDLSLFAVNLHTGEVRTKRSVSEQDDSSQRLLIEIKDNGESVQSTTVTVDILIEDGLHESTSDFRQKATEKDKKNSKITFYLILSLASVSVLSLLTCFVLLIKCARSSTDNTSCCISRDSDGYKNPNRNLQIQLNTDGPIKYVEVLGGDMMSQSQSFGSYLSPVSEFSDLTFVKPSSTLDFKDTLRGLDASLPDSAWTFESQQQKPPNDWRLQPNQRPGPSGQHRFHTIQQRWTPYEKSRAGPLPEGAGVVAGTGPWPNPPTEAEQLHVLMAGANVSEATATMGPRYNAQYVPDYRQNVYIPGSTATLTANPQQPPQQALPPPQVMPPTEAPKAAQTPASKKKSTKKDKK